MQWIPDSLGPSTRLSSINTYAQTDKQTHKQLTLTYASFQKRSYFMSISNSFNSGNDDDLQLVQTHSSAVTTTWNMPTDHTHTHTVYTSRLASGRWEAKVHGCMALEESVWGKEWLIGGCEEEWGCVTGWRTNIRLDSVLIVNICRIGTFWSSNNGIIYVLLQRIWITFQKQLITVG